MDALRRCLLLLLCYSPTSTTEKTYLSEATEICAEQEYEIGCGNGDGTKVMNVTQMVIYMAANLEAFNCALIGGCVLHIGDDGDDVKEQPLLNLFRAVTHNCQGKPSCSGILPTYDKVKISFPAGAYYGICGWEETEYLSKLNIVSRCLDVGRIETLPPYVYEVATEGTTAALNTTTTTTTTTTTEEPTTEEPTTEKPTTEKPTITKSVPSATLGKGKQAGKSSLRERRITEMLAVYIVLGVVAGLAALVGVCVTIYVLINRRTKTAAVTKTSSLTEYPLKGHEQSDLDVNEKQPMN